MLRTAIKKEDLEGKSKVDDNDTTISGHPSDYMKSFDVSAMLSCSSLWQH